MKTFTFTVKDAAGIHARPAGILAKEAKKYVSKIEIVKGEKAANVTKLMAVMALGVKSGETVEVRVSGDDEEAASQAVQEFLEKNL